MAYHWNEMSGIYTVLRNIALIVFLLGIAFAIWFIVAMVHSSGRTFFEHNVHFFETNGRVIDDYQNPISGAQVTIKYLCYSGGGFDGPPAHNVIKEGQVVSNGQGNFFFNSFDSVVKYNNCAKELAVFKKGYCASGNPVNYDKGRCAIPDVYNQSRQILKSEEGQSPDIVLFLPRAE